MNALRAATHPLEPITNSHASKGVVSSGRDFEAMTDRLQDTQQDAQQLLRQCQRRLCRGGRRSTSISPTVARTRNTWPSESSPSCPPVNSIPPRSLTSTIIPQPPKPPYNPVIRASFLSKSPPLSSPHLVERFVYMSSAGFSNRLTFGSGLETRLKISVFPLRHSAYEASGLLGFEDLSPLQLRIFFSLGLKNVMPSTVFRRG